MKEIDKIYHNDCIEGLQQIDKESIDMLVTDPPYALVSGSYSEKIKHSGGFMGKKWDAQLPSIDIWKECLRVMKPGSFAFIMCIPRQDCLSRMIINLEEAGFKINFTSLYHVFSSGFPKSCNISKSIDRKLDVKREVIGKGYGKSLVHQNRINKLQGFRPNDYYEDNEGEFDITIPASKQAKELNGSYAGFQPKPAVEIILVCMKPLSEKSYVDQALKNKKGVTWLDNGRIPFKNEKDFDKRKKGFVKDGKDLSETIFNTSFGLKSYDSDEYINNKGRFPGNILISNDILNDGKIWKHGGDVKGTEPSQTGVETNCYREYGRIPWESYEDSGSFSRYFSLDAWFDNQLKKLPKNIQKTFPFLIVPKSSASERNIGCEHLPEKEIGHNRFDICAICGGYILQNPDRPSACHCKNPVRKHNMVKGNVHPSVKPISLMMYLITLGSRSSDTILDPFIGSGTTAIASKLLGRHYIGFEINKEYVDIAQERIKAIPEYYEQTKQVITTIKQSSIDNWL